MVFTFTLNFQRASDENGVDAIVERLAEEGCSDAFVGVGARDRLALECACGAHSAYVAIERAVDYSDQTFYGIASRFVETPKLSTCNAQDWKSGSL